MNTADVSSKTYRTSMCPRVTSQGYCNRLASVRSCQFAHNQKELRCIEFAATGRCSDPQCTRQHYNVENQGKRRRVSSWGAKPRDPIPDYCVPLERYPLPEHYEKLIPSHPAYIGEARQKLHTVATHELTTVAHEQKRLRILQFVEECTSRLDMLAYTQHGTQFTRQALWHCIPCTGLSEKRPSVLRGDAVEVQDERTGQWYGGYVHFVNLESLTVSLPWNFSGTSSYTVVFSINRVQERARHRAIDSYADLYITPQWSTWKSTIAINSNAPSLKHPTSLVTEQHNAVVCLCKRTSPNVMLLWGPPGTGKTTTTVAAIVATMLQTAKHHRILVVAPSNEAVDLLLRRLRHPTYDELVKKHMGVPIAKMMLRLNAPSRAAKHVPAEVLECSFPSSNGGFSIPSRQEIEPYRIVLATISTSNKLYSLGISKSHFTHLFVDEAGHATEADLLLAVQAAPSAARILLAGDHKQLGPVIHAQVCVDHGMDRSPLERLWQAPQTTPCRVMLVRNYRSDPRILALVNELYDEKLIGMRSRCPPRVSEKVNLTFGPSRLQLPLHDQAVVMMHHNGAESREADSPSWMNLSEAHVCIDLAHELHRRYKIPLEKITLLSPYRKQVAKLEGILHMKYANMPNVARDSRGRPVSPLAVHTIETFQGRENDVIILSCVRNRRHDMVASDRRFNLGFFRQPRRVNVAISRARDMLFVVGNLQLLHQDDVWKRFLTRAAENGKLYDLTLPPTDPEGHAQPWTPDHSDAALPSTANTVCDVNEGLASAAAEQLIERLE